jgi:hypothetical protein
LEVPTLLLHPVEWPPTITETIRHNKITTVPDDEAP